MVQTVQKIVEVPEIVFVDRVVDIPVTKQRQVPMVQTVQKTVEIPEVAFVDVVVDVPVTKQRQVPMVQTVQKMVEIPQSVHRQAGADSGAEAEGCAIDPEGAEDR